MENLNDKNGIYSFAIKLQSENLIKFQMKIPSNFHDMINFYDI